MPMLLLALSALILLPACSASPLAVQKREPVVIGKNYLSDHIKKVISESTKRSLIVTYSGTFELLGKSHSIRNVIRWDANGTGTQIDGVIDGNRYDPRRSIKGLLISSYLATNGVSVDPDRAAHGRAFPLIKRARANEISVEPRAADFSFTSRNFTGTRIRTTFELPRGIALKHENQAFNGLISKKSTEVVSSEFPPYLYSSEILESTEGDRKLGHPPIKKHMSVTEFHFE